MISAWLTIPIVMLSFLFGYTIGLIADGYILKKTQKARDRKRGD